MSASSFGQSNRFLDVVRASVRLYRGEDDDRQLRMEPLQTKSLQYFPSRHDGHHQVEEHDVRQTSRDLLECLETVPRRRDREPLLRQDLRE